MNELIYGIHAIQTVLKNNPDRIISIYIIEGRLNRRLQIILQLSKQLNIPVQYCHRHYLNNKVKCVAHQGVVAKIRAMYLLTEQAILRLLLSHDNKESLLFLVLDSITDPRNMGACLRCAYAFGVNMVIVPKHRSVGLTAVVRKSASGVVDTIPFVRVVNLVRILKLFKQYDIWIVGTVLESNKNIFQAKLTSRLALVMGSEDVGIRYLTRRYCDELINIPMFDSLISLNVAVATGVCLFEVLRRRVYSVV